MGGTPIQATLMYYFDNHPDERIHLDDLVADLGDSRERVLKGVNHLLKANKLPGLTRQGRGGPWIYDPNHAPANNEQRETVDLIGTSKSGALVIEYDGKLYKAVEIE